MTSAAEGERARAYQGGPAVALREDAVSAPVRREPTRTAAAQQATPRDDIPNHPTTLTRRWMITTSVVLGSTLYSTTLLIASTLLPQIQGAISTQDEVAWVMTFNILATAVVTPMTGWMVARLGRRTVMASSMLLFSFATFLCGAAQSLEMLVLWRILQGASGAPVTPLAQTILFDILPRRSRSYNWCCRAANGSTGTNRARLFWRRSAPPSLSTSFSYTA